VVALKGELDLHTQPLAEDAFAQVLTETAPHPPGVIADLSELTFCDSTGLSALISARHRLAANGRPLVLAGVHDRFSASPAWIGSSVATPQWPRRHPPWTRKDERAVASTAVARLGHAAGTRGLEPHRVTVVLVDTSQSAVPDGSPKATGPRPNCSTGSPSMPSVPSATR
jgi:anti-anti-sigma factor